MNKMGISFDWKYTAEFDESFIKSFPKHEVVHIPHTNKELPFNNFSEKDYQFVSSYEKVIDVKT